VAQDIELLKKIALKLLKRERNVQVSDTRDDAMNTLACNKNKHKKPRL